MPTSAKSGFVMDRTEEWAEPKAIGDQALKRGLDTSISVSSSGLPGLGMSNSAAGAGQTPTQIRLRLLRSGHLQFPLNGNAPTTKAGRKN
jgi:hypothetical protein